MKRVISLSRYLDSGLSLGWWRLFVYGVLTVVAIAVLIVDVFLSLALDLVQQILEPRHHQWYRNVEPINDEENIPETSIDRLPAA